MRTISKEEEEKLKAFEEAFIEAYHKATGVFNNFFGPLMTIANDAFNEALDMYEGTPEYKFMVKKGFKMINSDFEKWWGIVHTLFDDRYPIYIDYCAKAAKQLETDVQKLYWSTKSSLMRAKRDDSTQLAWLVMTHLLLAEASHIHKRFCNDIREQTKMKLLPKTFSWADPKNIEIHAFSLIEAVTKHSDIFISNDMLLALRIISQRLLSHDWQDRAAIDTLYLDDYKEMREEFSEDIDYAIQRMEARRAEAEQANEEYRQRKAEERKRHSAFELDIPATLAKKYKVIR